MKINRINLLAGTILAASSLFPLVCVHADEKKYEMPEGTPYDKDPAAANSNTRVFMTYGKDKKNKDVPIKTVRITNNSDQTIYPIMRDPNSATTEKGGDEGLYDPYDKPNKEYRGYIGYEEGEGANRKFYFGLKPKQSILVKIPLVFWNGARMGLGTDGKFLTVGKGDNDKGDALQNPLRYRNAAQRAIAPAEIDNDPRTKDNTITNGVVMWYRAETAEAPNDDTEDQLVEWSIRDNNYLKGVSEKIADTELVNLINYDVSNVDNLYLPVSMQVLDAWVEPQKTDDKGGTLVNPNRNGGWTAGSLPKSNGWTGSIDKIDDLQKEIRKFTATPNEYLGEYFGKQKFGWPYYNMPDLDKDDKLPIKIPSGANIFAQSPIKAVHSSYKDGKNWQNDKYMLSSGGTEAISFPIGAIGDHDSTGKTLELAASDSAGQDKLAFVKPGFIVTTDLKSNPLEKDTKVVDVKGTQVILDKDIKGSTIGAVFTFTRPSEDYAAGSMIRLWFSWAEYYRKNWKQNNTQAPTAPVKIEGSMDQCSATIEFKTKQNGLVPGMSVSGPGLDEATTEDGVHQGKAVILEVAGDGKSVIVSQVAKFKKDNQTYTFAPPEELIWTPKAGQPGYPLLHDKFQFPDNQKEASRDPYLFAQKVYLIMASMNQIGKPNNDSVCKFMQDVVGANMGYIFDAPAKASDDGKMVTSMIRDMIKSVLRGVTDFTEFPDVVDSDNKHLVWYPNPATKTGNQDFNVFNLDPFVWFVHVKLGFSGYGFSVDDDTADIGAGGANRLQITVAGPNGLDNLNEWSIQAPFGPIKGARLKYSGPNETVFAPGTIKEITRTTEGNVKITTVGASNMRDGDEVFIDQVPTMPEVNEKIFKVRHAKKESFELVDKDTDVAIPFSGQYTGQKIGRFGSPKQPYIDTGSDLTKIFHLVQDDDALRTFQGTLITVNGVSQNKDGVKFRVQRKGDTKEGRLILNTPLTNADGSLLLAGDHVFDFIGSTSKEKKK